MRKFKFLFFLPLLFCTSLQATELYTTAVQKGLSDMLNPSGKFTTLKFSDGTTQTTASGGAASVAFSAVTGSATSNQLPIDNIVMDSQALIELERLRAGTYTLKHYGNLVVDGFSNMDGIVLTNGTYTATTADVKFLNSYIEQTSISGTSTLGDSSNSEYRIAQSFTLDNAIYIPEVEVLFQTNIGSPSGSVTVKIETDTGSPTGNLANPYLLASKTITQSSWNKFIFTTAGSLTSGVYWLALYCDNQATDVSYRVSNGTQNAYANGSATYKIDGTWTAQAVDIAFKINQQSSGNIESQSYLFPYVPNDLGCVLKLTGTSTNISAEVSRNGGGTYTPVTLVNIGSGTEFMRTTSMVDVSSQPIGSSTRIKIYGSQTGTRIQGFGIFGK